PLNGVLCGLGQLLNLLDERLEALGLVDLTIGIHKRSGGKPLVEIAVEQRVHTSWQDERGKKLLIETTSCDDVKCLIVPATQSADHGERQLGVVGHLFTL